MPEPTEGLGQSELDPKPWPGEPAEEPVAPAPATEPEPTPEPKEEPTPAPKYGGKTSEQMAAELAEKDRVIADLFAARAKAEHEASLARALAETGPSPFTPQPAPAGGYAPSAVSGAPAGRPQIPPFDPKKVVTEEEFLADPIIATDKINAARMQYNRAVEAVHGEYARTESAQGSFLKGREAALKATPKLFEGVTADVEKEIVQSFKNRQLSPEQMAEPKTWQLVAELVRRDKGELDFGKYYKPAPQGMSAVRTEKPQPGPAAKPRVSLTADQRQLVSMWGMSEDTFLKAHEREGY